jgi:hypothetical protein
MANFYRFGRRMPIPSTLQIKHELRVLLVRERGEPVHKTAEDSAGATVAPPARLAFATAGDVSSFARQQPFPARSGPEYERNEFP